MIREGWEGPTTATLNWPTGLEGIPKGFKAIPIKDTPTVSKLIPFDTGDKALLVSSEGIFVLESKRIVRLLPSTADLQEHFSWLKKEHPNDPLKYDLSMAHGAISPDGRFIAAGHQSSMHCVFDAKNYELVSEVGHESEYPHFAVFSSDGTFVAFNSCHFYNGATIGVSTSLLPGLRTKPNEPDKRVTNLDSECRVYAAVGRDDEFIIGDANGYLRAFDFRGKARWRHFIGGTIGDIDRSRDGKRLVVTTYAGFLSIIDLDTGKADPFTIGTGRHREIRRWLFWKNEASPLAW